MNGKFRAAWLLLTTISLLSFVFGGRLVCAVSSHPTLSSHTTISGPLELSLDLDPAVAQPRDSVALQITLTNHQAHVATPELDLRLPAALSPRSSHLPAGTVLSYQDNTLSWSPIVGADGGVARLELTLSTSVADTNHPQQPVEVTLRYDGQQFSSAAEFWLGLAPTVAVRTSPALVPVGVPVQLTALIGGSGPFKQRWDLGDGRHLDANNPQVVYAQPGTYQVSVNVANPLATAMAKAGITVVATPAATFSLGDPMPTPGQPVEFVNQSGGQPPHTFVWDFGDGTTSNEANPIHAFHAPGTYTVRLLVENEHGVSETSQTVAVGVGPIVDLIIANSAGTGQVVHGQAYSDDSVSRLQWDMGDGRSYEGETVDHVYYVPGDYLVTVRGENDYGSSEVSQWLHVVADDFFMFLPMLASTGLSPVVETPDIAPADKIIGEAEASAPGAPPARPVEEGSLAEPRLVPVESGGAAAPLDQDTLDPAESQPPGDMLIDPLPIEAHDGTPVVLPPSAPLPPGASPAESLLWYINEARRLHNLSPLAYNYELSIAAQMHSEDMAGNSDLMHDGSDGSMPAERQRRYGYTGFYGGEAVAWGWDTAVPVVEFWVNSPPHRVLILDPDIREVGVGYYADGRAPNIWYWTAEFGVPPRPDSDEATTAPN
jgi:PKD repeat protein